MIDGTKQTLKQYFGYDSFRPGQERMVSAILSGEDALGVMPTGAGKSICYQVPALMLQGLTLVISPLVSLMGDQVRALKEVGARPSYLNSSLTPAQQNTVLKRASEGWYQIMYVAPERLSDPRFVEFAQRLAQPGGLGLPLMRRTAYPNGARISGPPISRSPTSSTRCPSAPWWRLLRPRRLTAYATTSPRCSGSIRRSRW